MQVSQGGIHMTLQQCCNLSHPGIFNGSMDPSILDQGEREVKEE